MIKVTRFVASVAILGLVILGVLAIKNLRWDNPFGIKSKETTHDLILEKVTSLGQLEVAKYHFKDIIEQKLIRDYLPDPKALLIVYGEATGCINLAAIKSTDIKIYEDKIVVILPKANLCSYKINHEKSRIYDTSNAFMNEALLFEEAYKSAEQKIKETALQSNILVQSEENAAILLRPLLASISQKEVVFE